MSKPVLIIVTILELLTLLPAGLMCLLGGMVFDAPGSERNPLNYMFIYSIWGYVICVVAGLIIAWDSNASKRKRLFGLLLPLIPIGVLVLAIVLSQTLCNGQASCPRF